MARQHVGHAYPSSLERKEYDLKFLSSQGSFTLSLTSIAEATPACTQLRQPANVFYEQREAGTLRYPETITTVSRPPDRSLTSAYPSEEPRPRQNGINVSGPPAEPHLGGAVEEWAWADHHRITSTDYTQSKTRSRLCGVGSNGMTKQGLEAKIYASGFQPNNADEK